MIQDVGKRGLEVNFYMSACHEGSDASPRDRLRSRLVGHEHTRHGCTLADTSILRSTQNEIVSDDKIYGPTSGISPFSPKYYRAARQQEPRNLTSRS